MPKVQKPGTWCTPGLRERCVQPKGNGLMSTLKRPNFGKYCSCLETRTQSLKVPSLQGTNSLVHSHEEVADILSQCFFPCTPRKVAPHFPDDPPPQPPCQLAQIDKALIEPLLRKAANRSAPGQSGHTWILLKWAWEADPNCIVNLLKACLKARHHPHL